MKKIYYFLLKIFLFSLLLYFLYFLYKFFKKKKIVNDIIKEWKKQTNGKVIKDKNDSSLKDDNDYSHVHLILNPDNIIYLNGEYLFNNENISIMNEEYKNNKIYFNFLKIMNFEIYYIPKKFDKHPEKIVNNNKYYIFSKINQNKPVKEIVEEMIINYNNFHV
jgi:hypothetical protein